MSQIVYFSYAFYQNPSFYSSSIKSYKYVTGYRSLFYQEEYGQMFFPFSKDYFISRQLLENVTIWFGVMVILTFILIFLMTIHYV